MYLSTRHAHLFLVSDLIEDTHTGITAYSNLLSWTVPLAHASTFQCS